MYNSEKKRKKFKKRKKINLFKLKRIDTKKKNCLRKK